MSGDRTQRLGIYVPASEEARRGGEWPYLGIARGSAMVAAEPEFRWAPLKLYFEGDIYGAHGGNFRRMLLHASDRLVMRYPTVAVVIIQQEYLRRVGWAELDEAGILQRYMIDDEEALQEWRDGA